MPNADILLVSKLVEGCLRITQLEIANFYYSLPSAIHYWFSIDLIIANILRLSILILLSQFQTLINFIQSVQFPNLYPINNIKI